MTIQIDRQIAAVRDEIALRRRVYAGWVRNGKMEQPVADRRIAEMQAVQATLEQLRGGWRAMVNAPLDGSYVALLIRHPTWWLAQKSPIAGERWEAVVRGQWIDHNGGGWCWSGMSGTPIGWRPLDELPQQDGLF